jgi:hypothetical protein
MKQGSEDHAKFKMLARLLRVPLPYANGIMERLWNKAAQFRPDGAVGRWSNLEIAEYCAMPLESDPDALVDAMVTAKLLDLVKGVNRLIIHDWAEHCTHFTHNKLARQQVYFANGEAPNLKRLDRRYRPEADAFYGVSAQSNSVSAQSAPVSAQSAPVSAQSAPVSAQSAKINVHEKSFMDAQSGKKSAQSPLQRARPTPTPTPTPTPIEALRNGSKVFTVVDAKSNTAAASSNGHNGSKWPAAAEFLQNQFPGTDAGFENRLAKLAQETIAKSGGDPDLLTDAALRDALQSATFPGQKAASGYKRTLPNVVANWSKK